MMRLQSSRWKMSNLFVDSTRGPLSEGSHKAESDRVVRRFEKPSRLPVTPIEIRLDATLRQAGPVSVSRLAKTVAADLYTEELRRGAGVLDIGLFGDRLFERDVLQEIKAGDGILWEIGS